MAGTERGAGWQPLRWLGVRSYGIYLWHFPIIVLTTPAGGRESLARETMQVAASIGAAALFWRYIEEPVRHGAIGRWWAQVHSGGWDLRAAARRTQIAVAAALVAGVASCGLSGVVQPSPSAAAGPQPPPSSSAAAGRHPASKAASSRPPAARTSCRAVVHIGDSTSEGLISPDYLPRRRQRIAAQYARVGVTRFIPEISGARSIVETYDAQPNAYTVAQQLVRGGYRGCWVLALGTNDTANVYVGSPVSMATRIQKMMSLIGSHPVMWVNVKSLLGSGPYSESDMQQWNRALLRACARYPNMRVYDWAAAAKDSWFISDGIHYTSRGYAARGKLIARGLAAAFPQGGQSPGCLVQ